MEKAKGPRQPRRASRPTGLRPDHQKPVQPPGGSEEAISKLSRTSRERAHSPTKLPVVALGKDGISNNQTAASQSRSQGPIHRRQNSAATASSHHGENYLSRTASTSYSKPGKASVPSKTIELKHHSRENVASASGGPEKFHGRSSSLSTAASAAKTAGEAVHTSASCASSSQVKQNPLRTWDTSFGSVRNQNRDVKSSADPGTLTLQNESPIRLQSLTTSSLELLELHTIHSKAEKTQKQWSEGARQFYKTKFEVMIAFKVAFENREKDLLTQRNASAIIEWGSGIGGDTIERRLQVFSSILDETWQLTSTAGRYDNIVQAFEHWYEKVTSLQERQVLSTHVYNATTSFTEGLGDGWRSELISLQESLLEAANSMLSVGDVDGDSDIARSVALLLELIKNMLEELELMDSIEACLVLQLQSWVQNSITTLNKDIGVA